MIIQPDQVFFFFLGQFPPKSLILAFQDPVDSPTPPHTSSRLLLNQSVRSVRLTVRSEEEDGGGVCGVISRAMLCNRHAAETSEELVRGFFCPWGGFVVDSERTWHRARLADAADTGGKLQTFRLDSFLQTLDKSPKLNFPCEESFFRFSLCFKELTKHLLIERRPELDSVCTVAHSEIIQRL